MSLENINDIFKIPICFNKQVKVINNSVMDDLELVKTNNHLDTNKQLIDKDESPIYHSIFNPNNTASAKVVEQFATHYTTDSKYLKDTQLLIKSLSSKELNTINNKHNFYDSDINTVVTKWEEIIKDTGFCEKYLYIDWQFAKELNNNASFLQIMSIYNIASPLFSLCLPIFVLIIPFFIIKLKGIKLDIKEYVELLKTIVSNHAIFKVFTQFHKVETGQKLYLVFSAAFYLFSIYQNILVCIRFYSNMKKIHDYIATFKPFLAYTLDTMNYFHEKTRLLANYNIFNNELKDKMVLLGEISNKIEAISPFGLTITKLTEVGNIMHVFYQLHDNIRYKDAFTYAFGFNGYFQLMVNLSIHVKNKKMVKTQFIGKNKNKTVFKAMYYPKFVNNDEASIVKNDCSLEKNIIITGPNASGKTTTLKTALINIILSQQVGFGCFKSLKLKPYDFFHCYLNIPDTSGRDSLFQAEARRCKEIIDCINDNEELTHFCIFDELYSGTNPDEAIISAGAFMDYIVKNNNVACMLTTHYIDLCKKLSKNNKIKNYHMQVSKTNNDIKYTYLMKSGISSIKGGLKVLHDMNYPQEILNNL